MAVYCGDKENQPPATAPFPAAARRHGVAVKNCRLKRLGKVRRRVPLRDITNLFLVDPVAAERGSDAEVAKAEPPAATVAVQKGLAGGAAAKAGVYSLRKEFR